MPLGFHEPVARFEERHRFLHLLLGVVSLHRRLDAAAPPPSSVAPSLAEDRALLALLGLASLTSRLVAAVPPPPSPAPRAPEPPPLRDLLR